MVNTLPRLVALLVCIGHITATPTASPANNAPSFPVPRDVTQLDAIGSKVIVAPLTGPVAPQAQDSIEGIILQSLATVKNWQDLVTCSVSGCILLLAEALFSTWDVSYVFASGISARDVSPEGHAVWTYHTLANNSTVTVTHTQIMPLNGHLTIGSMLDTRSNASAWAHVFNRQYNNDSFIQVHHRRITDDETGDDNGRLQQMRAYHYSPQTTKRAAAEEDVDEGVVMDYIWNAGDRHAWDVIHGDGSQSGISDFLGTAASTFMEDTDAIATCASLCVFTNVCQELANHGVIAFGWNNQPFSFNGRAGQWVNECGL